jgi:rare lipoprotein A
MRPAFALVACAVLVSACSTAAPKPTPPSKRAQPSTHDPNAGRYTMEHDAAPKPSEVPADVHRIPEPVPRAEPRSRGGNSPSYSVFGKTYRVLDDARGFRERGYASWYGKKFHGNKTANGEVYDMFQMTAAHKSLPLPSYARVTRLDNGKSVVVRVNDRGPFHAGRVIDLSYAAAARLDMLQQGSAKVEVVALDPLEKPATPTDSWLQVAAYADPINAVVMKEELVRHGHEDAQILIEDADGAPLHRVVLGPFRDARQADSIRSRLQAIGYAPTPMRQ